MGLGPFSLLSLLYAIVGVRVVWQLIQNGRNTFDRSFSQYDRYLVDQAAFFVLVPVSVVLHELGHAVAIWSFGRDVVDYGFYGFAGYVAYDPTGMSATQGWIISAAGSLVNLILCGLAAGLALFWRPPFRAAWNELLIQFAWISGLNAFVLYPIMDLLSNLNGDWRQMYDSGEPMLTVIIIAVQVGVLGLGYVLATNPRWTARINQRCGVPNGFRRGLLGGLQPAVVPVRSLSPDQSTLHDVAERVTSGWPVHVTTALQPFGAGNAMSLQWQSGTRTSVVAVRMFTTGITEILRIPVVSSTQAGKPVLMQRWTDRPSADDLTIALRVAMETAQQSEVTHRT